MLSTYEDEGGVARQIQFTKTKRVQAKDRFQALPPILADSPTLPQIWQLIQESGATIKDASDPLEVGATSVDSLKQSIATGGN
jgi:hypothetical protein